MLYTFHKLYMCLHQKGKSDTCFSIGSISSYYWLWVKYKSIKMRFCQIGGQVLMTLPTIQWQSSLFRFILDLSIHMTKLELNWHYCYWKGKQKYFLRRCRNAVTSYEHFWEWGICLSWLRLIKWYEDTEILKTPYFQS